MIPRFRFAPSPTGEPHVGSLHTALFSWALARAMDGDFILRIDDTDRERNQEQAIEQMIDALRWLGLEWDEGPDEGGEFGPYRQSERTALYEAAAQKLLESGAAYYGDEQGPLEEPNQPLRLSMPKTGQTILQDAIRGEIVFDNATLKNPVIVRSDGSALYHLASAVDDHEMQITHALRGDDWISSAPIQIRLYEALGWQQPVWIHVPLILNRHGQKLSKRDPEGGYLLRDFQQAGYLPRAMFNYLLLLGWSPEGEQELLSKWDVRQQLKIERLSPSAAQFDWDKLNWMNQQYIKKLSDEKLAGLLREFLEDAYGSLPMSDEWPIQLTRAIRDELVRLEDVVDSAEWAFDPPPENNEAAAHALAQPAAAPVLTRLIAELATLVLLDDEMANAILQALVKRFKAEMGLKAPEIYHPIRAALTGMVSGPPLPAIMGILGKQRCLQRIAAVLYER